MQTTEKLFYKEPFTREFKATVVDVSKNMLVLDKTLFFPQGGYQEYDNGVLTKGDALARVNTVSDENGVVYHQVDSPELFAVGDEVEGRIDWDRRWYLSTLHSAQHVISRIVFNLYKVYTTRSDFSVNGGMVSFSVNFSNDWIEPVEVELMKIAEKALPVERLFDGANISIKIADLDTSPCGGTHVTTTADLGSVYLLGTDKGKLLFDGGGPGTLRLKKYGREHFRIRKMYNFPDDVLKTVEDNINTLNDMDTALEKYKREAFSNALKDETLVRQVKGIKVSVIKNDELDTKIFKKLIKMKDTVYTSDLYLISIDKKIIAYAATDAVSAIDVCAGLINESLGVTGGGNRKKVDMMLERGNFQAIVDGVLSKIEGSV
ncbi:MAG: alanyl-tRNA editing protein [Nitrospirae bacterium]|nr:alanyl-tRNA editing protein [Nitrospirota bacterium]